MEKKEDSKRCDASTYELVEKKRKMRDESELSSKVSPLRSCLSSSSRLPCDMDHDHEKREVVRPLSRCSNSVDEKSITEVVRRLSRCSNSVDEKCITELKRSPLLSSEKEKKVFVNFISCEALQSAVHYYRIDPNKSTNTEIMAHVSSICSIPSSVIPRCFGSVALGSKIYMIGGVYGGGAASSDFDGSRDIFSFDTASINNDQDSLLEDPPWRKEDTQLLAKRGSPRLVATHGKIYVFGCLFDHQQPWGEVFDPISSTCLPLAEPPFDPSSDSFEIVANGNKIFSCGLNALYYFDVNSNLWTEVSTMSSLRCPKLLYSRAAIVDDIMFTFFKGDVLAYDFATENWFERPVEGFSIPPAHEGHMVHIGNGTLSLLWSWYEDDKDWLVNPTFQGKKVSIRCLTFRVKRVTNAEKGSFLVADILAQSAYCITSGDFFDNCFAI